MPVDQARHLHARVLPGARLIHDSIYSLPCDGKNLPTLRFQVSGEMFEVPPSLYILQEIAPGRCMSGFAGEDVDGTAWILGDVFLRGVYSVSSPTRAFNEAALVVCGLGQLDTLELTSPRLLHHWRQ